MLGTVLLMLKVVLLAQMEQVVVPILATVVAVYMVVMVLAVTVVAV